MMPLPPYVVKFKDDDKWVSGFTLGIEKTDEGYTLLVVDATGRLQVVYPSWDGPIFRTLFTESDVNVAVANKTSDLSSVNG
jgi:hypothetical protein